MAECSLTIVERSIQQNLNPEDIFTASGGNADCYKEGSLSLKFLFQIMLGFEQVTISSPSGHSNHSVDQKFGLIGHQP
jgi:hypothetical protein